MLYTFGLGLFYFCLWLLMSGYFCVPLLLGFGICSSVLVVWIGRRIEKRSAPNPYPDCLSLNLHLLLYWS